jgi:glycosyltransferase involved in cell wall biosynthesis
MKIVRILHPWMPEYRKAFFLELTKLGHEDGIQYEIFAPRAPKDSRNRSDELSGEDFFTKVETTRFSFKGLELIWHKLPKKWSEADLIVVENAIRNLIVFKWFLFGRPQRLAMWGHGKTFTKNTTVFKEKFKSITLKRTDWFFGYTEGSVNAAISEGYESRKTTVVLNSTDTKLLRKEISEIQSSNKSIKEQLLFDKPTYICTFVGALDASKRLDFLIDAASLVKKQVFEFQLHIYGEGPELKHIQDKIKGLDFIYLLGRADAKTLSVLSIKAALLLIPGRVGLAAVDSLTMGVPIVTTNWGFHAPEFEYLRHDYTTIVTEDLIEVYASEIVSLLRNQNRISEMRKNCLHESSKYSIEEMSARFHKGVLNALSVPKRNSNSK